MTSDDEVQEMAIQKEEEKTVEKMERMHTEENTGKEERLKAEEEKNDIEKKRTVDKEEGDRLQCSGSMMSFIRKYLLNNIDKQTNAQSSSSTDIQTADQNSSEPGELSGPSISHILGLNHPKDIALACSRAPYCLYLYKGVELGDRQTATVILIGYLHQRSGVKLVRLLDTLPTGADKNMNMDGNNGMGSSLHGGTDTHSSKDAAESRSVIETLKKYSLPLSNLAVFYCDSLGLSREFVPQVLASNPGLVSLSGLPGLAGRACHAGMTAFFQHILDLVRDIYYHYTTCTSPNDNLKELFLEPYSPSVPISHQSLFLSRAVKNMAGGWDGLLLYFRSLEKSEDAAQICTRLTNPKFYLDLLFLSKALDPLCAFREVQQCGVPDVAGELQLTSTLAHSYTTRLLRPDAAERFLRRRDPDLLHNDSELLPDVSKEARDFMLLVKEEERREFLTRVVSFYKAVTESLTESLPARLGDLALRNIAILLKPRSKKVRAAWLRLDYFCFLFYKNCIKIFRYDANVLRLCTNVNLIIIVIVIIVY